MACPAQTSASYSVGPCSGLEVRKEVTVVLHPLTDTRSGLMIVRTGEELKAPKGFMLVASYMLSFAVPALPFGKLLLCR